MANKTVTIKVSEEVAQQIISFYDTFEKENPNEYVRFFAKDENTDIAVTLFKPTKKSKGESSCVFQGPNAENEAAIFAKVDVEVSKPQEKKEKVVPSKYPQIGSDEVGTGDFFGPISVCAAYVDKSTLKELKELGVTDSKKLSDEFILKIGPTLVKKFPYSQLLLENQKYNEVHEDNNMNKIKAKMHNRCILNLKNKYSLATVYQDQFAEAGLYYSYLKDSKDQVIRNINFSTKGELKYPSIALASCIARYSFLKNMKELSEKYKMDIPFGCNSVVEDFAVKFAKKYGIEELDKVVKKNFVTYKAVLERLK